ncbi:MAG: 2-amino-4-hydroxy-6-hydroxymethyldihydropteridine diphosphokinase [Planctomycetaceae bacterium]
MPNHVALLLGSNLDPWHHLPRAVVALRELGRIVGVSHVWQSAPLGDPHQPDYCNLAVLLETELTLEHLWSVDGSLRTIETALGRVRDPGNKNAARTIDIDVSLFNEEERTLRGKAVPDPDLQSRACAAVPVSELPEVSWPAGGWRALARLADRLQAEQPLQPRPDIDALVSAALVE